MNDENLARSPMLG